MYFFSTTTTKKDIFVIGNSSRDNPDRERKFKVLIEDISLLLLSSFYKLMNVWLSDTSNYCTSMHVTFFLIILGLDHVFISVCLFVWLNLINSSCFGSVSATQESSFYNYLPLYLPIFFSFLPTCVAVQKDIYVATISYFASWCYFKAGIYE